MDISKGEFVSGTSYPEKKHQPLVTTTTAATPTFSEKEVSVIEEGLPNDMPTGGQSIPKKLVGYGITIARVSLKLLVTVPTLLVVCALSVPVALIKIPVEVIINRYMHYKKYHPSTRMFNCIATAEQKRLVCERFARYYDDFLYSYTVCLRQIPLQNQPEITDVNNFTTHRLLNSEEYDFTRLATLCKYVPKKLSKSNFETMGRNEKVLNKTMDALERFMDSLYHDKDARNQLPKENLKFIKLKDDFSDACEKMVTIIAEIPETSSTDHDAREIGNNICLYNKLDDRREWFVRRYKKYLNNVVCPYCCPMCSSLVAETAPYIVRACVYTLPQMFFFSMLAPVMGIVRSAQMVVSRIWGGKKPINYFPWHPGQFHRFPFSRPGFKGLESLGFASTTDVSIGANNSLLKAKASNCVKKA